MLVDVSNAQGFGEIVGRSLAHRHVLHLIEQVAPTGSAVLLTGETGTGKELAARAIRRRTRRFSLNLAWTPISRLDLLAELLTGTVNKDLQSGNATQIQFASRFRF